jgi:GNAT superfamily N-acetyltransferase
MSSILKGIGKGAGKNLQGDTSDFHKSNGSNNSAAKLVKHVKVARDYLGKDPEPKKEPEETNESYWGGPSPAQLRFNRALERERNKPENKADREKFQKELDRIMPPPKKEPEDKEVTEGSAIPTSGEGSSESKVAAMEKKLQDMQDRLELTRERRKMRGQRIQSTTEIKLAAKMSELRQQIHQLKSNVTESASISTHGTTSGGYTWRFEAGREMPFKTDVDANTFIRVTDPAGKTVAGVWADVAGDSIEIEYSQVFDERLRGRGVYTDLLRSLSKQYTVISDKDNNNAATSIYKRLGADYDHRGARHTLRKQGVAEGATVTRIDSKPITDFATGLKSYKHTDDWNQSGLDTGDDSYWKNKNLKTKTTKGLFAGDPRRTALYATGNAHETRYVEFTQNGQPIVYFDKKDLPAIRSRKTYLTVFDAGQFKKLPTGEWFSKNPGKPIEQTPIGDPFKYIASQGWVVRVTDDLDKVFKQVQQMHKAGKIAHYGAEGMNESQQGVAEGYSNFTFQTERRRLNVPALIKAGALFVTYPHGEQGWGIDKKEDWAYSLISLYNVMQGGWPAEAKKYIKPASYKHAEQSINSSKPNLGSNDLVYDGKYNQILWSIEKLKLPDNVAFLDNGNQGVAEGRKKKNKKTSRYFGGYFFPGYGYYGSGESGEGGGDGGGGESMAEGTNVDIGGIKLNVAVDGAEVIIRPIVDEYQAGYAVFDRDGNTLVPADLAIDEEFRGQGIAKIIYDYVKSLGFNILRSNDQTRAGKHFWDKNRGEGSQVWEHDMLDEACWKGYHKKGMKTMFGKRYPNCVKNTNEGYQQCPECGGPMFSEEMINEKKDACYYKVKSRYKVWPSAYASGALVQCRKKGANNWGTKSESSILEGIEQTDEDLHKWFKEKWVRFGPDGKIRGACARGDGSEGKPKCLPQSKAQNLGKKGRASAASRKRREDPNPERSGKAINVATKKKTTESSILQGISETKGLPMPGSYEQEYGPFKKKGGYRIMTLTSEQEELDEKWSDKYKRSIDCKHPKGFSQRAHCQGKKKK